jgi:hypothetical protein
MSPAEDALLLLRLAQAKPLNLVLVSTSQYWSR